MERISPEVVLANYAHLNAGARVQLGPVESRMLLWSKSGRGTITINRRPFDIQPYDYFVIPWNHVICYDADPEAPFHLAGIHLVPWHDPRQPVTWSVAHTVSDPLHNAPCREDRQLAGLESLLHFRLSQDHALIHLSEYTVMHFIGQHRSRVHLRHLALVLLDEVVFTANARLDQPSQIQQLRRFIEHHISSRLNVHDLAAEIDRSASQVTRLCRRHLERTPGDWINDIKISSACDQLRTTRESIAGIASSVGFADQFYFSRLFKKKMGVPPLKYRQQQPLL